MTAALLQVAATIVLVGGQGVTTVRNPADAPVTISVELRTREVHPDSGVIVGRAVRVMGGPWAFTLLPGASQVLRLRLQESFLGGTTLGLCVTFTPVVGDADDAPATDGPVARLVMATRVITKVVVR